MTYDTDDFAVELDLERLRSKRQRYSERSGNAARDQDDYRRLVRRRTRRADAGDHRARIAVSGLGAAGVGPTAISCELAFAEVIQITR